MTIEVDYSNPAIAEVYYASLAEATPGSDQGAYTTKAVSLRKLSELDTDGNRKVTLPKGEYKLQVESKDGKESFLIGVKSFRRFFGGEVAHSYVRPPQVLRWRQRVTEMISDGGVVFTGK